MPVQCDAVGVDDRLPTHLPDDPDQFDDVRVNERVPARDAHAVAFPEHPESLELTADLIEALVPEALQIPVTAFAAQVALVGRLEPGDAVVGIIPGETVIPKMIQFRGHRNTP